MPVGQRGTFTHGRSAYVHNYCRCKEICTPAHTAARAAERAAGRQRMNGGGANATLRLVDDTVVVGPRTGQVIEAWLRDGADPETIGRRVKLSKQAVHRHLGAVQEACGFESRLELAVAILRGFVTYRVDSPTNDETSESSETLEEKEERHGRYPTWPRTRS